MRKNRLFSFAVVLLAYAAALFLCLKTQKYFVNLHPLFAVLYLDLIATAAVFLFSLLTNNSSMYDAYWSAAPPVILAYFYIRLQGVLTIGSWLFFAVVCIWALRLTINWVMRWRNLEDEDWRYADFRKKFPRIYWAVSFFGIHYFPTLIVYLAMIPLWYVFQSGQNSLLIYAGAALSFAGVWIETDSDIRLRYFMKNKSKKLITSGLWGRVRYPNYLGEIMFWAGAALAVVQIQPAAAAGFLPMLLMFIFISIPMKDKKLLSRRSEWKKIIKTRPALIPDLF